MLYTLRRFKMNSLFKTKKSDWEISDDEPSRKEQKTTNQLLLFCDLILKYEKYKPYDDEEMNNSLSSNNSEGSSDVFSSESNSSFSSDVVQPSNTNIDADEDSDSSNLITCYCMKPYANRPMIECSICQTWLHMSCAIVRRHNIPDYFVCQMCREAKGSRRRSARLRSGDRPF